MTITLSLALAALLSWGSGPDSGRTMRQDYKMITYYLVLLKRPPAPPRMAPEAAAKLQADHLAYLGTLGEQGFGMAAGPFEDDGEIRGIVILKASSAEHARELQEADPAVKAGRLVVEVIPFMAPDGWFQKPMSPFTPDHLFFGFLKTGNNRSHDAETAAKLQKEHLAYMEGQAQAGTLVLAGPITLKDSVRRGIIAYRLPTLDHARAIAEADPMVKAGRLSVELHPWMVPKGILK